VVGRGHCIATEFIEFRLLDAITVIEVSAEFLGLSSAVREEENLSFGENGFEKSVDRLASTRPLSTGLSQPLEGHRVVVR